MNTWTDERREQAIRLWKDGLSSTQIAAALGKPYVTRNAVIGVIHRNGLQRPAKRRMTKPHPQKAKPKRESWSVKPVGESLPPEPVVSIKVQIPEPVSKRVSLLKLKSGQCKWPEGDGPIFYFCGARALKVERIFGSYCEHHRKRAYQPLAPRRIHVPA